MAWAKIKRQYISVSSSDMCLILTPTFFIFRMTEVYRPTQGELLTRSALNEGVAEPVDSFKKSTSSRPGTSNSGYRFGQMSHNSFFTRHNPHPSRVRHLKGTTNSSFLCVSFSRLFRTVLQACKL